MSNAQIIDEASRFSVLFKTERLESGLSQRELAELCEVDHTYISKIENGKVDPPSTDTIVSLCFMMGSGRVNELLSLSGKIDKDLLRNAINLDPNVSKVIAALVYGYLDKATVKAMLRLAEDGDSED